MKFDGILSVFHHNSALLHSLVLVASYLTLTFGNLCGVKQIASEAAHEMDKFHFISFLNFILEAEIVSFL